MHLYIVNDKWCVTFVELFKPSHSALKFVYFSLFKRLCVYLDLSFNVNNNNNNNTISETLFFNQHLNVKRFLNVFVIFMCVYVCFECLDIMYVRNVFKEFCEIASSLPQHYVCILFNTIRSTCTLACSTVLES